MTTLEPLLTSSLSVEKWLMTTSYCTVPDPDLEIEGGVIQTLEIRGGGHPDP